MNPSALILLSGGIDSAVALWKMKEMKYNIYTITFDYNKRFKKENECCSKLSDISDALSHKTIVNQVHYLIIKKIFHQIIFLPGI